MVRRSVNRAITECTPQELLPIIPPRVQWSCVDGSGPNVRPCSSAASAKPVEDDARLDARELAHRIDLEDPVQVLREVEDDRDVAASGRPGWCRRRARGRARRARGRRRPSRRRRRCFADDHADRNLAVVRPRPRRRARGRRSEADLALDRAAQVRHERRARRPLLGHACAGRRLAPADAVRVTGAAASRRPSAGATGA